LAGLEDMEGHDVPLVADNPQHHHCCREFCSRDNWNIAGVATQPSVIARIHLLVLSEFFSSEKKIKMSGAGGCLRQFTRAVAFSYLVFLVASIMNWPL
jgi:hypothetical protein